MKIFSVQLRTVIVLLLFATFLVCAGSAAYLTYLVVDGALFDEARQALIDELRGPTHAAYQHDMAAYRARLENAMATGSDVPLDAPAPPDEPKLVQLIQCRWCAGLWVSLVVVVIARLVLAATYPPLWYGLPLAPLDLVITPAWVLANAYAVGWLASNEGGE